MVQLHEFMIAIFTFLLIISGNFINNLFPCRIQSLFETNIYAKHFLGFFTLLFFETLTLREKYPISKFLPYTFIVYFYFLLLTNTNSKVWITIFVAAGMLYLLHLYREEIQSKTMVNDSEKDSDNETNNIVVTGKTLTKMIKILEVYIVAATLFGFLVYMGHKKFEYKNKFNYIEFLFGHVMCKHDSPDLSIMQSLKHTFD